MSTPPEAFPGADANFIDPGVSNGDVDWLFRGREVKKLNKRSNTINNEVQSQLLHAQQMMMAQQAELDTKSEELAVPQPIPVPTSLVQPSDTPLKSSMKSSLSKINTAFSPSSHESAQSAWSALSAGSDKSGKTLESSLKPKTSAGAATGAATTSNLSSSVGSNGGSSTTSETKTRSRSSSNVLPNPFAKNKPAKKSIFSSLSAKLKGASPVATHESPSSKVRSSPVSVKASPPTMVPTDIPKKAPTPVAPLESNQLASNLKKLESVPFKRVNFALNDLIEDPQQQIPSRRPKRGNVLIPDDLTAPPPKLSIGITNSFNEQTKDEKPQVDPQILEAAIARQNFFSQESKRHLEEAHLAAMRMAKEVAGFSQKGRKSLIFSSEDEEEEDAKNVTHEDLADIDTPIHNHVNYFDTESSETSEQEKIKSVDDITLETLYTRCCHLREILPIPATLKQLKNKHKPLHVLKMLNPRPTYIDILSFTDFLAIAPVITVIFDNVTIDTEMINIILVSLKTSKVLNKLSLRNVPIDQEGWRSLSKFLIMNKSIQRLDLSQQKVKKVGDSMSVLRSELDWDLFIDALCVRGGIEELVIHGCTLNCNQFDKLISKALSLQTKRLGLASSQLDKHKMKTLANWISHKGNTCIGIDFGFNDLSNGEIQPLIDVLKNNHTNINLQFFSLNSTKIKADECIQILKELIKLPNLRFLDLGNNPHLFPDIIPVLLEVLPKYPDLRRLHFEFDELTEVAIVQLCFIFQKCPNLVHVSLLGNQEISSKSSASIYGAVKNSKIYNLDLDYDKIDEEIASRIAYYLMRNMEKCLSANTSQESSIKNNGDNASCAVSVKTSESGTKPGKSSKLEDLIFDGALLTKAAGDLIESVDLPMKDEERKMIYKSIVDKTVKLRSEIHGVMNKLFARREMGKLSTEGKENLLRFCLLDDSFENILKIFNESIEKIEGKSSAESSMRPAMMRQLSAQLTKHLNSGDVIESGPIVGGGYHMNINDTIPEMTGSEDPHQVVAEADRFVDDTTGKPVLMRNISQTYSNSKKLEEEEGELHRWGFFVQQQNDIMPDEQQEHIKAKEAKEKERIRIQKEQEETKRKEEEQRRLAVSTIPSGPELRETIMKAKGIESINDLINKVNKDFSTVENIYKHVGANAKRGSISKQHGSGSAENGVSIAASGSASAFPDTAVESDDLASINSAEHYNDPQAADEMYDRILDHVVRVRSNK